MPTIVDERDPVERLAEEFLERFRRGERPGLTEYTTAHPELADEIRELFPALVMMEQVGADAAESQSDSSQQVTADGRALEQVGEYRIIREIGRGGMGVVYEAEQISLGRHVALKVLPFHAMLAPHQLERFHREARAAAQLHHSNIVPVFGVGEDGGVHFFAMQFIQGQALDEVVVELRRLRNLGPRSEHDRVRHCRSGSASAERAASLARALSENGFIGSPSLPGGSAPVRTTPPIGAAESGLAPTIELPQTSKGPDAGECGPISPKSAVVNQPEKKADFGEVRPHSADRPHSPQSDLATSSSGDHYFASVARIGLQIADALAYAHQQGVLDRDIKPANLLLDGKGTVWVTDFGLAKSGADDNVTGTGDIVGTLRYMAPERFDGWCDPRSDIYSLGLTLYELLALRPAFEELDRGRLIQQILRDEPPRPRKLDRRIPRDLETIALKAGAKEPMLRYQTAEELAEDLRRFLADKPIHARRSSVVEQSWRWCRGNPLVAGLVASVALLLTVVAIGSSLTSLHLRSLLGRAEKAEGEVTAKLKEVQRAEAAARNAAARAQESERLAERRLFESLLAQARAGRLTRQTGQRFASLQALSDAARLATSLSLDGQHFLDLRNEAIASMALPDLRVRAEWKGLTPNGHQTAMFDLEMTHYARADGEGNVSVRRVADDTELALLPGPGYSGSGMFSPDGVDLAVAYGSPLHSKRKHLVWNWRKGSWFAPPVPVSSWSFSPDSRFLAAGHRGQRDVVLYELDTQRERRRIACDAEPGTLAFHPDGTKLAVAARDLEVREIASGKLLRKLSHPAVPYDLDWHPDGRLLAVACNFDVSLWDTATGRRRALMQGHQGTISRVSFSQGGDVVATSSWDGTSRFWETWSGRQLLSTTSVTMARDADWEHRGVVSSFGGTMLRHWDVTLGREFRTLSSAADSGAGIDRGHIHPNGRWLAVAAEDGVRLWDLASERELAFLPLGRTKAALLHPRGDELITSGPAGLFRWLFQLDGNSLCIGPCHPVPVRHSPEHIALDSRGRHLAMAAGGGGLMNLEDTSTPAISLDHPVALQTAISPDGRWAATATWNGFGVRVWNVETGKLERELIPEARTTAVEFSPDGRWLLTSSESDFRFWEVGSWELRRQIAADGNGRSMAFTRDGRLLALAITRSTVRLLDPHHGETLADLTPPFADEFGLLGFSADGGRLLIRSGTPSRLRIWDLRRIRKQLAEMGLDWSSDPLPVAPTELPEAIVAQVDLTGFPSATPAAKPTALSAQDSQSLEAHNRNVAANPNNAKAYYDRGAFFDGIKEYEKATRDLARALELFNRDIEADPNNRIARRSRGYVFRREGKFAEAAEDFSEALNANPKDISVLSACGRCYVYCGQGQLAIRDLERLTELAPNDSDSWNYLAWALVNGPLDVRDAQRALPVAQKAIAMAPRAASHHKNLSIAYYRLGEYDKARESLNKAVSLRTSGAAPVELLFLAMIHHRQDQRERAQELYRDALRAWQEQANVLPSLLREWGADFETTRAEAAELLGIANRRDADFME